MPPSAARCLAGLALASVAAAGCAGKTEAPPTSTEPGRPVDGSVIGAPEDGPRAAAPDGPRIMQVFDPRDFSVTATPATVAAGQLITLTWTAPPGSSESDRIGLYLDDQADDPLAVRIWAPTAGRTSGTAGVPAPCVTGRYNFRYVPMGQRKAVVKSDTVAVTGASDARSACKECTIYVATTGKDTNSGQESDPLARLPKVAAVARAGDTICLHEGTYGGFIAVKGQLIGTAKQPIVFRPYPGEHVVIDAAASPGGFFFDEGAGKHVTFEGFEITSNPPGAGDNAFKNHCPIDANHHCVPPAGPFTFKNLHIHHIRQRAIQVSGDDVAVIDNYIHDLQAGDASRALMISGSRWRIEGNVFHDVGSFGIMIYSPLDDSVVARNIIYNDKTCPSTEDCAGILSWGANRVLFKNNLIFGDHLTGIRFSGGGQNRLFNNTITGAKQEGLNGLENNCSGCQLKNNIVFGNGRPSPGLRGLTDRNLIDKDPLFADPAKHDFRLRPESPALDLGLPLPEVLDDLEGGKRPQPAGAGYDVGAYEMP